MLPSLFAAISGLEAFQTDLDVVGNNIANVDTVGFKSSRALFANLFYQTIRGASAPTATQGGTNPVQIGLGTSIADIYTNTTQGNLEETGVQTDMAVQGEGYFIVQNNQGIFYTRAGHFNFDANGYLVDAEGDRVLGWMATNGTLPTTDSANMTPLQIPITSTSPAQASKNLVLGGNLSASATSGSTYTFGVSLVDSLGRQQPVTITFTNTGTNSWSWTATWNNGSTPQTVGSGTLSFNTNGTTTGTTTGTITFTPPGASALNVTVNLSAITQFAGANSVTSTSVDGFPAGNLQSISVDASGELTGIFTNGLKQVLGQVALATFPNPAGLAAVGQELYQQSNNSGQASIGAANTGNRGQIAPGTLEMSNVDLSQEFTQMMIAQRAFEANAQVITTSNSVLGTLVQLIR